MLHPGDYPSQFYDEEDDERDVNSAVKTALTVLGKVHSMTSFISYQLTLRLSNSCLKIPSLLVHFITFTHIYYNYRRVDHRRHRGNLGGFRVREEEAVG